MNMYIEKVGKIFVRDLSNSKKGSLLIETTVILPLFIIAVIIMAYCVRVYAIDEFIGFKMCDETRRIISYPKNKVIFASSISDIVSEVKSSADEITGAEISAMKFSYADLAYELEDLYEISLRYKIDLKLPIDMTDELIREKTVVARGFSGRIYRPSDYDSGDEIVWVFPEHGSRYHKAHCRYIKVYPKEKILTSVIKSKGCACKICASGELALGDRIMIFNSGKYHKEECSTVTKYVISIPLAEAAADGRYTPCSKCMV